MAVQAPAQAPAPQASPAAADPGQPPVAERRAGDSLPDVVTELDDDEQLKDAAVGHGVQQVYLQAFQKRLKEEAGGRATPLLKPFLDEHDWWLRAVHADKICRWLGIECLEPSYYRDVYVWLPDVRWGREARPFCFGCRSNARVSSHCWRGNHQGRRVVALDTHYFTISRRYKCQA